MFDLTPLTRQHLLFFGMSFVLVHFLFAFFLKRPKGFFRQVPGKPSTYYGGAVLIGVTTLFAYLSLSDQFLRMGLLSSAFITLLIGATDEKYKLTPIHQLLWQFIIAALAVLWGWSISYISHPLSQTVIALDTYQLGPFFLPGSIITVAWLLLLINAMNWLDGADGLAPGVGLIALLTLALLSLLPSVQDSVTLFLALVGAGAILGLLTWNFPPARVYLGTSGSWFLGLYVGIVAILTGGKIVTTLLVLAIPVFDLFFVIFQRFLAGQPPWRGDTYRHLHHRLLAHGFSPRQIVLLAMFASVLLGWGALSLQTYQKMIAFMAAAFMLILLSMKLIWPKKQS